MAQGKNSSDKYLIKFDGFLSHEKFYQRCAKTYAFAQNINTNIIMIKIIFPQSKEAACVKQKFSNINIKISGKFWLKINSNLWATIKIKTQKMGEFSDLI
ncbi:unnamed protein product [Paramecium primaurelia]|uniref:Uncharacterized protein n=1 Tax=Paramecium primaurelia TaxID=5886 RepID=A0A8S1NTI6_PARPR|nr:unnamed protein product [Paramecium primaurelia]